MRSQKTQRRRKLTDEVKRLKAQEMRRHPTRAEARLWSELQRAGLTQAPARLTRQKLLHGWIADIFCSRARLVIEVDGPSHLARRGADAFRDKTLAGYGYLTLRIRNEQVFGDPLGCVARVRATISARLRDLEGSGTRKAPPRR